ncbi:MAG: glutathione peroxidase [Bacteroidetes bacterium]|nr:glutathione peroxidase [Bacteroidota bacterium]
MTFRQQVLKTIYPALLWLTQAGNKNTQFVVRVATPAPTSFYSLAAVRLQGEAFDWSGLKGKKILIVNTASDCGYTSQYAELQSLHKQYADRLVILGFPCNQFKEQEKGSEQEIASFCQVNYGVTFPLFQKADVKKGISQHSVYQWLTDSSKNGWNKQEPVWNFSKYLIDEEGRLTHYIGPSVSPLDPRLIKAIAP